MIIWWTYVRRVCYNEKGEVSLFMGGIDMYEVKQGKNCAIGENVEFGPNVVLGHNCIIEDNVKIGAGSYIDSNTIIRSGVNIQEKAFIGSNCIIGEYWMDFCMDRTKHDHPLYIGKNALIRSGSIIYAGSEMI